MKLMTQRALRTASRVVRAHPFHGTIRLCGFLCFGEDSVLRAKTAKHQITKSQQGFAAFVIDTQRIIKSFERLGSGNLGMTIKAVLLQDIRQQVFGLCPKHSTELRRRTWIIDLQHLRLDLVVTWRIAFD